MALGILSSAVFNTPAHLFLFQLLAGSSAIGLTTAASPVRPLTLPMLAASSYAITKSAAYHMRPRWASLLAGMSFAILLRYIDTALISRWDYIVRGPTANDPRLTSTSNVASRIKQDITPYSYKTSTRASAWARLFWGWSTLWSFRQINTPYEVRNSPPFSTADADYVPRRWSFVVQKTLLASCCYLLLDLLAQRPTPGNAASIFNPALIPFFRRLGEVTWPQIKLRAISIVMFGFTFYCVIQGAYSFAAAVCVGTGLSDVRSWRPPFGAFSKAYSLKNFWGKVWHQNLRRLVSSPASYLVYNVLGLDRQSPLASSMTTLFSFGISGIMHLVAGHASGMPLREMGVVEFFCTQACGIILEVSAGQLMRRRTPGTPPARSAKAAQIRRYLGYCWVLAFLTWSGPMWLYPQAARQSPNPNASTFVPFSVIQALRR